MQSVKVGFNGMLNMHVRLLPKQITINHFRTFCKGRNIVWTFEVSDRPNFRTFSSDKPPDKSLNDILRKSKGKKSRKTYPSFNETGEREMPAIADLLSQLRGEAPKVEVESMKLDLKISEKPKQVRHAPKYSFHKVDPYVAVAALGKHVDISTIEDSGNAVDSIQAESYSKPPDVISDKEKKIVPDETEVGGLLKALMQNKVNGDDVKEIMANIQPGSRLTGNLRKQWQKNERKAPRGRENRQLRGIGFLLKGPRSHYLDDLFTKENFERDRKFVSIHEQKMKQALQNAIPNLGPKDGFEEIMQYADKMWQFPIDNEQGLDEQETSTFEDHVFLDEHLEMFSEKGQIRKFMELVITGLQQNPYCTVQEKVDKIYWFKDYFENFSEEDLEF